MASRVRKLFHRKKGDDLDQQHQSPPQRLRGSSASGSGSNFRHSLYQNTVSGDDPEQGQYPLKGNRSETVLPGRRSSLQNHDHRASSEDLASYSSPMTQHHKYPEPRTQQNNVVEQNDRGAASSLTDDLSGLNLRNRAVESRTTPFGPYSTSHKIDDVTGGQNMRARKQNIQSSNPIHNQNPMLRDPGLDISRRRSIPRKEVGGSFTSAQPKDYSTSPSGLGGHIRQKSTPKPLPIPPGQPQAFQVQPLLGGQHSRKLGTSEVTAEEIVGRAKGNTYDTEVIEKIAPAVVHETITKDVHHIREEVITREVHNHEIYHRILPVIDVEVLPARHFLPVEGGGLVEVSADEVPSRGRNWVIAETASKIASDELPPHKTDRFSARAFSATEGDSTRYIAPGGYEKTEQTWVHPPELETGARDSGQTWPMEFGNPGRIRSGSAGHQSKAKLPKKQPIR